MEQQRYKTLNAFLRGKFGCRVHKITVDAGMTCPNRDGTVAHGGCIYCNDRGSGTGVAERQSVSEQLMSGREFLAKRYGAKKFIAYFQAFSNTYAPLDRLRSLYEEALDVEDIVGLSIGTRPDCVDDSVLGLLEELSGRSYINVEYGLQSVHDRTLTSINRGHDFAAFEDAVIRTSKHGIDVTVHVILGLPGETKADMLETARILAGMGIHGIKLHLLYVVRDTALHRMYEQSEYQCMSREDYVETVGAFLALLPPEMVIQRLTGDPHRDELVAPDWALEKSKNLNAIRAFLELHDIYQGMDYRKAGSE